MTNLASTHRRQRSARTTAAGVALVAALGLLAGCGDGSGGDNGDDAASAASPSAPGSQDFAAKVTAFVPDMDAEEALRAAEATCQDVADGASEDEVVQGVVERFSGDGVRSDLDSGRAQQLLQVIEQYVCSQQ